MTVDVANKDYEMSADSSAEQLARDMQKRVSAKARQNSMKENLNEETFEDEKWL